ncbi:MAG: ABC transporter substrate-binding protein [Bacteroides sp.]|nr:ABC transporter substrate-binding protein [Bacteroides sp.]MDU7591783.1 ABC transporter substrate-binding protein [Bacteroides sp.]
MSPKRQFWDNLKEKHPDALYLIRAGEVYRLYNEDAAKGADILGITMKKYPERGFSAFAEFPRTQLDSYLPKLVRAGERVAISEIELQDKRQDEQETHRGIHIAMLDAIGETGRVVGVSGIDYISNPDIQARRDSVGDVGYEGNINYELLLSLDPDLVLLYGVNGASSMEGKLKELDIPFMYVGDYLEESPLGKAEWLVALSEVIGKRAEGEKVFAEIPVRYNVLKKKVADNILDAPSVMLNTPYGDSWFMPSTESYVARLIKDAGGDYIYKKNTGNASAPIDLEEAYLLASQADMWLHVGMANTLDELKAACPKFIDTRCFRGGQVYNNNARTNAAGGNDYYESAVVNPDLVLRDLVKIFHPELVEEDFVYYKQLK